MRKSSPIPTMEPSGPTPPPIFQSIETFAARLEVTPRFVHTLARRPEDPLPTIKLGGRRLVPVLEGEAWASSQGRKAS
jgi:hypothetical protein